MLENLENCRVLLVHCPQPLLRVASVKFAFGIRFLIAVVGFDCFVAMVQLNLLVNQLFVLRNFQAKELEVKVIVADWRADGLVFLKVQSFHVWVSEGLFDRDSRVRVKSEHLLDQIDGLSVGAFEQLIEVFPLVVGQLPHEGAVVVVLDLVNQLSARLADQTGDHHHLLLLGRRGQQRFASDELSQDAANAPNINCGRVLSPRKNNFGGSVPARCNVVRHRGRLCH